MYRKDGFDPDKAITIYRTSGCREVTPFNTEPYADHWFEKPLPLDLYR
ncbi:MAG TPA: hypothetical protein VGG10_16445 [Rhizomicrobium sp.]|jgi:hypothetical protein